MYVVFAVSHCVLFCFFFFKQKTAYEMRISDWSSDVCSSDLIHMGAAGEGLWLTRESLRVSFAYPFLQLKCRRVTTVVASRNVTALAFNKKLGFTDRKSVVSGTSVSVRVDLGGRRIIKKKRQQYRRAHTRTRKSRKIKK